MWIMYFVVSYYTHSVYPFQYQIIICVFLDVEGKITVQYSVAVAIRINPSASTTNSDGFGDID